MNDSINKLTTLVKDWQSRLLDKERYVLSTSEVEIARERLKPVLTEVFGYHSLLYSQKAKTLVDDYLSIRNSFVVADNTTELSGKVAKDFVSHYTELPVSSDSIDLIVIPEALQHEHFPHQVLREVERVLIPEGKIILVVENIMSWKSIKKRLLAYVADPHFKTRVISHSRLSDWFRLLGFEISKEIPICLSYGSSNNRFSHWVRKLKAVKTVLVSNYLIVVAVKKASTLTPIRPSWRSNRKLVKPRLAEPTVRVPVEEFLEQNCYKER